MLRRIWLDKLFPLRLMLRLFCLALAVVASLSGALAVAEPQADDATTRIVSLVPNLTEISFAIGAGDQVVGVSDYCRFPAAASERPSVGGLVNPGLEAVLRLRPTVVLLYRSQTDFASRLKQLGVRSELFQVDSLADMYSAIDRLGTITGRTAAAGALGRDIKAGLHEVAEKRSFGGAAETSCVVGLVIVSRDSAALRGMYQAAAGNFLGELFEIAGGRLAVGGGAAVSREEIIRANPSLVIDMSGGESTAGGSAPVRDAGIWSGLSTVRAVRSGHVYEWKNARAMLLGPSVVETAREMRKMVEAVGR